jgi:hypothetical protein
MMMKRGGAPSRSPELSIYDYHELFWKPLKLMRVIWDLSLAFWPVNIYNTYDKLTEPGIICGVSALGKSEVNPVRRIEKTAEKQKLQFCGKLNSM